MDQSQMNQGPVEGLSTEKKFQHLNPTVVDLPQSDAAIEELATKKAAHFDTDAVRGSDYAARNIPLITGKQQHAR